MYGADITRTNTNPDETLLSPAAVDSLVPRWQAQIGSGPSPSSSSPVVAEGRVYVASSVITGSNFFAMDAQTGTPLWSADLGRVNDCFNVGIGATAAVSGSLVVAGGGGGAYYGLDAATGAIRWRNDLGQPGAFAWASPLIAQSRVYVGVASECDAPQVRGAVRSIAPDDGHTLAEQAFVPAGQIGGSLWQSPALSADGHTLVVATGEDRAPGQDYTRAMVTLDPRTLAIRAAYQEGAKDEDLDFGTTPVIFHDAAGTPLVGANHKDGTFYAYRLDDVGAGPVWQQTLGVTVGVAPAYDARTGAGGTLFVAGLPAHIYALDPTSGAVRWASPDLGLVWANIAVANGLVFVNTSRGLAILDEASGALLRLLVSDYAGATYSGVAVAHGFIYWVSGCYLNAWSLPAAPAPGAPAPAPVRVTHPSDSCGSGFLDVCGSDYFFTPVSYLACRGIISGYADGTFRPYNATTRAQMVKIVVGAFAVPAYTPPTPTFSDVPPTHPFYAYIEAAVHAGIVSGYADGTFRPGADVTRAQLAKIIVGATGWPLVTPPEATFADVPLGDSFAPFVETAVCRGLVSGYTCGGPGEPCDPGNHPYFRPFNSATRGQIAKITYNALQAPPACATPTPIPPITPPPGP